MHFVVIGHITRDVAPEGYTLGGTASYAGIAAKRLGAQVTLLTRARPEDVQHPDLADIDIINLPSDLTTTFHNVYRQGVRTQYLQAVAAPIRVEETPAHLFHADIVLLAPLVQEVDPAIAPRVRGLLGATPQGWLREWDARGQVRPVPWISAGRILPHLDALIFSDADIAGDPGIMATLLEATPLVALTKSAAGAILYVDGVYHHAPPRPAQEIDPTGAGDVFAAAFLMHLRQSHHPFRSAYFANIAASMSVEAPGTRGIPDRARVEAYIAAHPCSDPPLPSPP